ncbi:MAG: ion transporter [Lachnospiraceae bacterium]|nr:ion transporter [Lachnospiraceae bacterium]
MGKKKAISNRSGKDVRDRIFNIIEIGNKNDLPSSFFDGFIVTVILLNLTVTLMQTFEQLGPYMPVLNVIELVTIIIFTVEYILRVWTADYLYPKEENKLRARLKFVVSAYGLIDLFTIIPYFLPFIFPAGAVAFRIFRVIRIFRLFKINAQYDAFNVIASVIKEKKNQLISSMCMILILMIASSLCMYSLEHEAQPDSYRNAFSGIWWSVSTLLTVGYGDIYPVTVAGRVMAIIISFLGVGMVAIPTGIISAGFVEQYTELKVMGEPLSGTGVKYITSRINRESGLAGKKISEISLMPDMVPLMVMRGEQKLIAQDDLSIEENDILVIGVNMLN